MPNRCRLKRWISVIVVPALLMIAATDSIGADNATVKQLTVLGTAAINEKNPTDGRQNAVENALASAVGRVVMEMLTSETIVRRFQLINDSILNQRDQYIQNYRVLTESISGATIRTLVQVDVTVDRLSRDLSQLGLALSGAVYPRILFMIAERNVADAEPSYWWGPQQRQSPAICESAMAKALGETGFEIVPVPALNAPLNLAMNLSQGDMKAIGSRLGADVLISGTATAAATATTMGGTVQSFLASVDVQAIDVRTGQAMGRTLQKAVASAQDASAGGREALASAGALAGDDLARQVMAAWQQHQDSSTVIEVTVEGTSGQIAKFVKLRTAIGSLSGVKEMKMKEMATDHALIAVSYQGTARSMADALLLKSFSGFGIDILDVTSQAIRMRLINN